MKKKQTYLIYLLAAATLVFLAQRGVSPRGGNEFTMDHPSFPPVVISAEPAEAAARIKGWNDPIEGERFNPVAPMTQETEPEAGGSESPERRSIGAMVDGVVGLGEVGSLRSNAPERQIFTTYRLKTDSLADQMAKVSEKGESR